MDVYLCDGCGAQIKNKQPDKCPLCGVTEFHKMEKPDPTEIEKKEAEIYAGVVDDLEGYLDGCEPYVRKHYNSGE
jgi:DNA-directed RNA polymerase subunit RPC12/RpoP